ncbi:helicase-related protein [Spirillospora sp. NPDC046719]
MNTPAGSVAAGLTEWLIRVAGRRPSRVHLVTGFASIRGLLELTPALEQLTGAGHRVRLLMGMCLEESAQLWRRAPLEPYPADRQAAPEADLGAAALPVAALASVFAALCGRADRLLRADLAGIVLTGARLRLSDLLGCELLEARRYERGYLHAKTAVVDRDGKVRAVTGSSNLTAAGLRRNLEFNAAVSAPQARAALEAARGWWRNARDYDLAALVTELFQAHPHELVYLRMLAEAYDHEVNAPASPVMDLADYQRDGVARVRAMLARHGGALIADEVGLGKTYIAGEVARLTLLEGRGPVIVVAPAGLRPMWRRRLAEWGLSGVTVISYDRQVQLYRRVTATDDPHGSPQDGTDHSPDSGRDSGPDESSDARPTSTGTTSARMVVSDGRAAEVWQRCGLLIVDEAHALRNPLTVRLQAVRSLLDAQRGYGLDPQVLLMSATPLHNETADLFELLALADRSLDPAWVGRGTFHKARAAARSGTGRRLAEVLARPHAAPPAERSWYHQVTHARMLRRDRPFLRRAYPGAGSLRFPTVHHEGVEVPLPPRLCELYVAVLDAVGHSDRIQVGKAPPLPPALQAAAAAVRGGTGQPAALTLAAYLTGAYRLDPDDPKASAGVPALLTGLLRALLCKRLESSAAALAATAGAMATTARQALAALDRGTVHTLPTDPAGIPASVVALWDGDDATDDALDDLVGGTADAAAGADVHSADGFDTAALRADLEHDARILERLAGRARALIDADPKKEALAKVLLKALHDPRGPKIVVFAGSRETTHDLGRWLEQLTRTDPRFAALAGRIANLGHRQPPSAAAAQQMLTGFAPATAATETTEATIPAATDRYDVLICTDKFSEGVNLQQAALCVNYDLSWNPQRIGQRIGRLDRVGSPHPTVTCWSMLPADTLDTILPIMGILTRKAHLAADTVGVPTPLFPGSPCRSYISLLDAWHPDAAAALAGPRADTTPPAQTPPQTAAQPAAKPAAQPSVSSAASLDAGPGASLDAGQAGWAHARLGNARRIKHLDAAITALPAGAGAVVAGHARDTSAVLCFRVHAADGRSHTAGFAHVYATGPHAGHISVDTGRCLHRVSIDPAPWMHTAAHDTTSSRRRTTGGSGRADETTGGGAGRDPQPLERRHIEMICDLVDRARTAVATAHDVPAEHSQQRLHLVCWILLTGTGGGRGGRDGRP